MDRFIKFTRIRNEEFFDNLLATADKEGKPILSYDTRGGILAYIPKKGSFGITPGWYRIREGRAYVNGKWQTSLQFSPVQSPPKIPTGADLSSKDTFEDDLAFLLRLNAEKESAKSEDVQEAEESKVA